MDLGEGIRRALNRITGAAIVDEKAIKELVKELQRVLISNDVNVKLVYDLTKSIEEKAMHEKKAQNLNLREHIVKIVYDELVAILGEKYEPKIQKQKILVLGLFGSGKTTSIAKLAKFYQGKGLKVCVIAGDVHRPAAVEQLQQLAEQVHCGFFSEAGKGADEIARDSQKLGSQYDILIFDSAGRSAFDLELASELKKINELFKPDEKYLVVSADLGQVAGKQAAQFNEAVGVTGVIVTKMDGSGKGGDALSAVKASNSRVAFITLGEKPDALEVFDAKKFVARLVGFADLEELLSKVQEISDEEAMKKVLEGGKMDYEAFLAQMRSMKKMGPLKQILQMLGMYDVPEEMLGQSEAKMKGFEAAVLSMTINERRDPELMKNRSRQERVAKGAGLRHGDVRELVSNFEKMQKMMKSMKGNRGLMKRFGNMLPPGLKI
ncbi:MAG: signal recognition particle receptor subunit alpha [Candidatus Micrarchaeota archaeon]